MSPREIQARVRAGASVDQVVSETGWPADRVARYAEPPLRERAYIVELAQRAQVRGPGGSNALVDLVADSWRAAEWDAYRTPDGRWRVTASSDRARATWIYEPAGRSVTAVDEDAAIIIGREPTGRSWEPVVERVVEVASPPAAEVERPRLVPVPDPIPDEAASEVFVETTEIVVETPVATPVPQEPARGAKKSRRGRARVPSWDEILFGATRTDD